MRTHLTLSLIAILIALLGIASIYSNTYQEDNSTGPLLYQRQMIWLLFGLLFFLLISNFNYRRLWDITYVLYALMLGLLLSVFVLGVVRLGAQRWLRLAWFNFQPSEVAKLIMVIFLARYFSRKSASDIFLPVRRLGIMRSLFLPLVFTIIPVGLIIEQPDLGSSLMVLFIFLAMLFLSGVKLRYIVGFLLAGVICLPVVWQSLHGYQKERLLVFLNPNIDPLGAGYTVIQSKIAIGSGGFFGKGWLHGSQGQLHFLPEAHTDFIFATFAEEWGLFGCLLLLGLYYLLIKQGFKIAQRTQEPFGRLLAYGICLSLAMQVCINIAMNLGFAPVVGLPLPLMSYGGSSMVVTFIALGVLVNINKSRGVF